jgi:putative membrane protein
MPSEPPPPPGPPGGTPDGRAGAGAPPWVPPEASHAAVPGGSPREVGRFVRARRLHPASVVLGIDVRQLVQAVLFPVFATVAAGRAITVGFLLILGVIGLTFRVLAWQRFSFSFDGEVLRVEEGVLNRNQRSLDVARIQQVEIERMWLHRVFGFASLRVETAGTSSEVEVELRVIPEADAEALRAAVRESKARATGAAVGPDGAVALDADDEAPHELLRVPTAHVVLAAVTGVRLLVLPAVLAGALQLVGQNTTEAIDGAVDLLAGLGLIGPNGLRAPTLSTALLVAGLVLAASAITAVVVGLLRDANFRVTRIGDDLHVSRGLLSTRDSVLPLQRVQLVDIQRNWLRRLLGFAAVRVHSAGGSGAADRRVTVPLLRDGGIDPFLGEVFPGVPGVPELVSHPPKAMRRAMFRWTRTAAVIAAAIWLTPALTPLEVPDPVRTASVVAILVAALLGVVEYRQLAHGLTDRVVASRRGALSISTSVAPVVKVQAASTEANLFQRRLGLATVTAHVAGPGGDVEILDTGAGRAATLHERLTEHAAAPVVVPASELA